MSPQKVIQLLSYFDVPRRKFLSLAFFTFPFFIFYVKISDLWLCVTHSFRDISPSQVFPVPCTATSFICQNSLVQRTENKTSFNLTLTKRRFQLFLTHLHNMQEQMKPNRSMSGCVAAVCHRDTPLPH